MKKILMLLAALVIKFAVFAQMPGMMAGGGKGAPAIGHIYGKLVDSAGKPLSDVSIILLQNRFDSVSKKPKDVLLKGLTTKANGEFSFDELPMFGKMKLKISAVGYKTLEQPVAFKMQMPAGGAKPASDPSAAIRSRSARSSGLTRPIGSRTWARSAPGGQPR